MDALHPTAESFRWRDHLAVHPAADLFPLMSESELRELADDIKKNGLQHSVMTWEKDDDTVLLVDGRNRLDALALLGWLNLDDTGRWFRSVALKDDDDVQRYVISTNVRRRHLSAEQKRDLIAKLLKAQPEISNRQIAKTVTADHKTVGDVRRELEATGEIPQLEKTVGADGKSRRNPASGTANKREAEDAAVEKGNPAAKPRLLTNVSLEYWKTLAPEVRQGLLSLSRGEVGHVPSFNKQENDSIEWAQWSWNPVTGCLHNCPYCYARDIANSARMAKAYPHGFEPAFRPATLIAPRHMKVPKDAEGDTRYRNVFTCSMADLFGRWVPAEWIEAVLTEIRNAPDWNFLCLTKFPNRMAEFDIPKNAWMGTSVDLQARVGNAEKAFAQVQSGVRWLSIEPMLEPLKFKNLDRFDWIVIGGASSSSKTPEWHPPFEWVSDLVVQARAAGTKVYFKTNLGIKKRILELPFDAPIPQEGGAAPDVFHYLGSRAADTGERAAA